MIGMAYKDPEGAKAYREAHKEKIAARKKAYYEAHKEEIATRNKAYREAHKEEIAARKKAWYKEKAWYEVNKEKIAAKDKAYKQSYKGSIVSCLSHARRKCRLKGWSPPDFDHKWVMDQIIANDYKCHESGMPFDLVSKTKRTRPDKPSLQRKDPNKGYTKDNVIVTTWFWNWSVRDGVDGDFHRYVKCLIKKDRAEQKKKRDAAKRNKDQLTMFGGGAA